MTYHLRLLLIVFVAGDYIATMIQNDDRQAQITGIIGLALCITLAAISREDHRELLIREQLFDSSITMLDGMTEQITAYREEIDMLKLELRVYRESGDNPSRD